MRNTTNYDRGDIVLLNFVFTKGSGARRRPAVVVSSPTYQQSRQEAIVSAVTSNTGRLLVGDHLLVDWQDAGLLYPSVVTGIVRTVTQAMIERRLGTVTNRDMNSIDVTLGLSLGLPGR